MNTRAFPPQPSSQFCIRGSNTNRCKNNFASDLASANNRYVNCVYDPNVPYRTCRRDLNRALDNINNRLNNCNRTLSGDPYRQ